MSLLQRFHRPFSCAGHVAVPPRMIAALLLGGAHQQQYRYCSSAPVGPLEDNASPTPSSLPSLNHNLTNRPPPMPHPRVRSLYKEFMLLAHHHPTFTVDKCRTKIKEGFRRNQNVAVFADGSQYYGYEFHQHQQQQHQGEQRRAVEVDGVEDDDADVDCAVLMADLKKETVGNGVVVDVCATNADHHQQHQQPSSPSRALNTESSKAGESSDNDNDNNNGVSNKNAQQQKYSIAFRKSLAWGRYGLKDLEALINLHKYRAMKARYEWKTVDENDYVLGAKAFAKGNSQSH